MTGDGNRAAADHKHAALSSAARLLSDGLVFTLRLLIQLYRYSFAYVLGGRCRFTPSCSAYALEALSVHGPFKGTRLAVTRICRCHPWGGHGHDPVRRA